MTEAYKDHLFTIYIEPESIEELEERLNHDTRDKEGKRFAAGKAELERYFQGEYDSVINLKMVNRHGEDKKIATLIYNILLNQ